MSGNKVEVSKDSIRTILQCIIELYRKPSRWGKFRPAYRQRIKSKPEEEFYAYCLLGAVGHCAGRSDKELVRSSTGAMLNTPEERATIKLLAETIKEHSGADFKERAYMKSGYTWYTRNSPPRKVVYGWQDEQTLPAVRKVVKKALAKLDE